MSQYFDEASQPLSEVITDADPDNTSPAPETWPTWVERNSDGQVTAVYSPANLSAYDHSDGTITKSSSAGLIDHYVRVSSGDMKGFLSDKKHSKGTAGSQYLDGTWTWTSFTKTIGDVTVTRPLVASSRVYSQEITSGTTGSYLTQYAYTAYIARADARNPSLRTAPFPR